VPSIDARVGAWVSVLNITTNGSVSVLPFPSPSDGTLFDTDGSHTHSRDPSLSSLFREDRKQLSGIEREAPLSQGAAFFLRSIEHKEVGMGARVENAFRRNAGEGRVACLSRGSIFRFLIASDV